ncbi:MAG: chemotaxis protein methyltransferase CheR [Solirubrobacteraceae bacterium]|jgi:chemotaxis protein methyltransferase CheR|nr:chemotaxis protein methyltransferase CheR [Solirubrobacteraceae bacterium]
MDRATTPRPARPAAGTLGTLGALSAASGLALETFRAEHVADRIERALAAEGLKRQADLAGRLGGDEQARARFRRSVAVSHSGFFRDPDQFEALEQRVLPRLLEHVARLRVWSAGCATGLELLSLAVVLDRLGALEHAHLLGSDLLEENVQVARAGADAVTEITPAIRAKPRWERRDLVGEPPPGGHWDLVLCRNVAIYLQPEAKARLHRNLADALARGGVLMIGRSERLSDPAALGLRRLEPHVYERLR